MLANLQKIMCFGVYAQFNATDAGMYTGLNDQVDAATVDSYKLMAKFGVYASAIAITLAAIFLVVYAHNAKETAENKKYIIRVGIVTICIFGAVAIISLIQSMAI